MTGVTAPGGPDAPGPDTPGPDTPATAPDASSGRHGTTPRRRGRPPRAESADTRDRILDAAREEFSERGYDKTSVRGIAKSAGVDSALVHHYFGTKEQVFEAAVEVAFAPVITAGAPSSTLRWRRSASG